MSALADLATTIAGELGCTAVLGPPGTLPSHDLPRALGEFYGEADGLELPFLSLYARASLQAEFLPGWICFGQDRYFSFCLCRTDGADRPIALWDHESGCSPEGCYADVPGLIAAAYAEEYEDSEVPCTLRVDAVPADVDRVVAVRALKQVSSLGSAQLLGKLKAAPFAVPVATRHAGIIVMRRLRVQGIACAVIDHFDDG